MQGSNHHLHRANAMTESAAQPDSDAGPRGLRKNGMIYLLIGIPLTSVLLGVLTLYLAFSTTDRDVRLQELAPLSKTSWQDPVDDR
jgi:hypothetical protein